MLSGDLLKLSSILETWQYSFDKNIKIKQKEETMKVSMLPFYTNQVLRMIHLSSQGKVEESLLENATISQTQANEQPSLTAHHDGLSRKQHHPAVWVSPR